MLALLTGDLEGDGFVGISDLNAVLGNWNQNVTPGSLIQGDPSGDGFVGIEDLNTVLGNWNAGTPPAGAAVPEPASLAVLGMGVSLVFRRRS
ncbi:MAG: PEP-CTERM sorting domain-containing protein [Phycisphaerales bacterium]